MNDGSMDAASAAQSEFRRQNVDRSRQSMQTELYEQPSVHP